MLVTLIPLFDENMAIKAYSLFTQRKNFLLTPTYLGIVMYHFSARLDVLGGIE